MKRPLHLLIVDDEFWVRDNLRTALDWEALGISLTEPAVNGEDAIHKLEALSPDIMITDINMPFLSGNQLIKVVRERFPHVQTLVLSGYNDFEFVREALTEGAIDYLLKPVSKQALLEVIHKAIRFLGTEDESNWGATDEVHRGRLLEATSLAEDNELSRLLAEREPAESVVGEPLPRRNLDLELVVFSLVLVRLPRVPSSAYCLKSTLIQRCGTRTIVFHNIFSPTEFVILTDHNDASIQEFCEHLPALILEQTGMAEVAGVSEAYYSFDKLGIAYQEARAALASRPLGLESNLVRWVDVKNGLTRRRISRDDENFLLLALRSCDRPALLEVIFQRIGLARCSQEGWLVSEAKQTARYLVALIVQHVESSGKTRPSPVLENLTDLLERAFEWFDWAEISSLFEQVLDEVMDEPLPAIHSMKSAIESIQVYIDEHFAESLSLTSLANMFRFDRTYLSRAYKQVTGVNLMFAIAQKRIETASNLVETTGLSLSEIAFLVGYEEYAYFSRVFRKMKGLSPTEWKGKMNKENTQ